MPVADRAPTANVARLKYYTNETGATVMVAPVVFTSVLLALALATLASATDETGDADQRDRAWSWHCEVEVVNGGEVGSSGQIA